MHEDDDLCAHLLDETRVLDVVDVRGEGKLVDRHATWNHDLGVRIVTPAPESVACDDGRDFRGFVHDLFGHGAFDGVTCDNEAVARVGGPALEQLSGDTVLGESVSLGFMKSEAND